MAKAFGRKRKEDLGYSEPQHPIFGVLRLCYTFCRQCANIPNAFGYMSFAFVFSTGSHATTDVALLFIHVQHLPHGGIELRITFAQALLQICWCQVRNKKFWD